MRKKEKQKIQRFVETADNNALAMVVMIRPASGEVSVRVPGFWQGRFVEVYAVLTADPLSQRAGECSKTLYCGSGRIA